MVCNQEIQVFRKSYFFTGGFFSVKSPQTHNKLCTASSAPSTLHSVVTLKINNQHHRVHIPSLIRSLRKSAAQNFVSLLVFLDWLTLHRIWERHNTYTQLTHTSWKKTAAAHGPPYYQITDTKLLQLQLLCYWTGRQFSFSIQGLWGSICRKCT